MKNGLIILLAAFTTVADAQHREDSVGAIKPTRQTTVHDLVMTKQGDTWYLFCTGRGISSFSSKDMQNWKKEKPVFASAPQWAINAIPSFKGHIWAPDISYHNGKYYLYYSVSAFGKNSSLMVQGDNKEWFGAGHNAVCKFNDTYYIVYHGNDAKDKGKPKLIIDQLEWDNQGRPKPVTN